MIKDFIIVGGGPAGNAAALLAAARGSSVLLVERDALGGTCTNRGCIPTKFYLSRSPGSAGHAAEPGAGGGPWARLLGHKNALVRGLSRSIEAACGRSGVEIIKGGGRLQGPNRVSVTAADGSRSVHEGRIVILAAGSAPAGIAGVQPDGVDVITSTEALDLERLPASVAIVGSGAVGAEFAFIFSRFGVSTTIIEAADGLFPAEDPEVGELFLKVYDRIGVRVVVGDPVRGVERGGGRVRLALESGAIVEAEKALVAVGRSLGSGDLGCEDAGVRLGGRGEIVVDADQRTSVPTVLAAGDVTGRMLLAHVAAREGEHAVRRALGIDSEAVPYRSVPWATFTSPEVGSVGTGSAAAAKAGIEVVVGTARLMDNIKARIDRAADGFVRVVADRKTGVLVGGTVVGPQASDIVHVIALAVHQGLTLSGLEGLVFSHPGLCESIQDAVRDAINKLNNNNENRATI